MRSHSNYIQLFLLFQERITYIRLLRHYCQVHFQTHLVKEYNIDESNSCSICKLKFNKKSQLLIHLVKQHNALDGRISSKEASACTSVSGIATCQNTCHKTSFSCQLCDSVHGRYDRLVRHYCRIHFKSVICEKFKVNSSNSCRECGAKFSVQISLLNHLATVHGALAGKIPNKEDSKIETQIEIPPPDQSCSDNSCHLCGKVRSTKKQLLSHYAIVHFKSDLVKKYKINDTKTCNICQDKFTLKNTLLCHLATKHKVLKDWIRDKIETSKSLRSKLQELTCHLCGKKCQSKNGLFCHYCCMHYKSELAAKFNLNISNRCKICHTSFSSQLKVMIHLATSHNALDDWISGKESTPGTALPAPDKSSVANKESKTFVCSICGSNHISKKRLVLHYCFSHFRDDITEEFQVDDSNRCSICKGSFHNKALVLQHLVTAHNVLDKKIKKFKTKPEESKIKLPCTPFSCHLCGTGRTSKLKLWSHYCIVHYKSELVKKFEIDSTNRCSICDSTFTRQESLFSHLASVHKALDDWIPKECTTAHNVLDKKIKTKLEESKMKLPCNSFSCRVCGTVRTSKSKLSSHYCIVHFKSELVKKFEIDSTNTCNICNATFTRQESLFSHLASVHRALDDWIPKEYTTPNHQYAYRCHLCKVERQSEKNIFLHYTYQHFRETLIERYKIDSDNPKCSFCGFKTSLPHNLLSHLVCKHEALKNEIPNMNSLRVEVPNKDKSAGEEVTNELDEQVPASVKNQVTNSQELSGDSDDFEVPNNTKVPNEKFKCHICHQTRPSYVKLVAHYANLHYQKKLVTILNSLNSTPGTIRI